MGRLDNNSFTTIPFPKIRRLMVDGGKIGRDKHTIHGIFELDVTEVRQKLRDQKSRSGESISFTAFILWNLGYTISQNKLIHAYRSLWDQLILFDDVDINTLFEVDVEGQKVIRPHIFRRVNNKSLAEVHSELRSVQAGQGSSQEGNFIQWLVRLPGFLRRVLIRSAYLQPKLFKELMGTVSLTSVGMFASGGFWAIPVPNHNLQISLGGIAAKPGVVAGEIKVREYLSVTVSFNHDIIDGAPVVRFFQQFKELIERGNGLT